MLLDHMIEKLLHQCKMILLNTKQFCIANIVPPMLSISEWHKQSLILPFTACNQFHHFPFPCNGHILAWHSFSFWDSTLFFHFFEPLIFFLQHPYFVKAFNKCSVSCNTQFYSFLSILYWKFFLGVQYYPWDNCFST